MSFEKSSERYKVPRKRRSCIVNLVNSVVNRKYFEAACTSKNGTLHILFHVLTNLERTVRVAAKKRLLAFLLPYFTGTGGAGLLAGR